MKTLAKKPPAKESLNQRNSHLRQMPSPWAHVSQSASSPVITQRVYVCPCDGRCPRCKSVIQPKLRISKPNDKYEQEADRIADQVMRVPEPVCTECEQEDSIVQTQPISTQITPIVQREEISPDEEEIRPEQEEEELVRPKQFGASSGRINPSLGSQIQSIRRQSQPLPRTARRYFEPRFGMDFDSVHVHTGSKAASLSQSLNARAFTLGKDIVFGAGQYHPHSYEGQRLLAHELTHVMQQTRANQRNVVLRESAARVRPWQEVSARFAGASGSRIRLFSHDFAGSTTLASALQWIFDNSMARPTSFQFVSARETSRTAVHEAYLRSRGQAVDWYQEVALVWHLRRRRFVAYTTRHPTSTVVDPRQRANYIFVAHTHPTQTQVPGGTSSRVTWQTMTPSPQDSRYFHTRQIVSIICHRDPADNQTPVAFIYNRSGQVLARYRGTSAFQSAGDDFRRRERSAGTIGGSVGQYRRR